jgi:hypothetical protein
MIAFLAALASQSGCSEWTPGFEIPGVYTPFSIGQNGVMASAVFDDGSGPALYIGGDFQIAGPSPARAVARWDGNTWSPLGAGISGGIGPAKVLAMVVHDDGTGPALYVGGSFTTAGGLSATNIARWNGTGWLPISGLGTNTTMVTDLEVFDAGNGPRLFAVGGSLAEWNGADWLMHGLPGPGASRALEVFEGQLYVGSLITGSNWAAALAKWTGSSWTMLGESLGFGSSCNCDPEVNVLQTFDDGSGEALYVGGYFETAGSAAAENLAKWDGVSFSAVPGVSGSSFTNRVYAMKVFDIGDGPKLYVGGNLTSVGGLAMNGLGIWDGNQWSTAGIGTTSSHLNPAPGEVSTLAAYDIGVDAGLFVGGDFALAGGQDAFHAARWDGTWSPLGNDGRWIGEPVHALATFDDGTGPKLFAGGEFATAAGEIRMGLASWDGADWEDVGGGVSHPLGHVVNSLAVFDDGTGPALFAGGAFGAAGAASVFNIARWDGTTWQDVGGGLSVPSTSKVNALAVFEDADGPGLYATGFFRRAGGVPGFERIARWDGSLWSPLGTGLDAEGFALEVFDGGTGPALFAGGQFATAGGVAAPRIARWDGASWSAVGSGVASGTVNVLRSFDDGSGPALFVGGSFANAGGVNAANVARWDGSQWGAVGAGLDGTVLALAVVQEGPGSTPALYAGGDFTGHLARWDGSAWTVVADGFSDTVRALAEFDDGSTLWPSLFAGGDFTGAGELVSSRIARLSTPCGCPPESYCTAGTSASGCTALLAATGTASATAGSGFVLTANGVEGSKDGLFFFGTNGRQANPWGNGTSFVCVVPPRFRAGLLIGNGTTGACDGWMSQDLNAHWCPTCPKPLQNPGAGALVQAQLWYRDPLNTSNQTSSMSDAIEFTVCE